MSTDEILGVLWVGALAARVNEGPMSAHELHTAEDMIRRSWIIRQLYVRRRQPRS